MATLTPTESLQNRVRSRLASSLMKCGVCLSTARNPYPEECDRRRVRSVDTAFSELLDLITETEIVVTVGDSFLAPLRDRIDSAEFTLTKLPFIVRSRALARNELRNLSENALNPSREWLAEQKATLFHYLLWYIKYSSNVSLQFATCQTYLKAARQTSNAKETNSSAKDLVCLLLQVFCKASNDGFGAGIALQKHFVDFEDFAREAIKSVYEILCEIAPSERDGAIFPRREHAQTNNGFFKFQVIVERETEGDSVESSQTQSYSETLSRVLYLLKRFPIPSRGGSQVAGVGRKRKLESKVRISEEIDSFLVQEEIETTGCFFRETLRLAKNDIRHTQYATVYRRYYQKCWMKLMTCCAQHASPHLLIELLRELPKVIPNLSNPMCCSKFIMQCFDRPSQERVEYSIAALSGLFTLLTAHRLGDSGLSGSSLCEQRVPKGAAPSATHLYQRLFSLLETSTFDSTEKTTFLSLLNRILRSTLLPASVLTAFIKKAARVACLSEPGPALWLLSFTEALIQHNRSNACKALLSVSPTYAETNICQGDSFNCSIITSLDFDGKQKRNEEPATSVDNNLSRNKELEYSLWELSLLQQHFHTPVKGLAQSFNQSSLFSLGARKMDPDSFALWDTNTLLERANKKHKRGAAKGFAEEMRKCSISFKQHRISQAAVCLLI